MRLLLDTHVLLWALTDDRRLGVAAQDLLEDPRILVHVSAASIWEVSIKSALGRLELDGADLVAEVGEAGFGALGISAAHAWAAGQLPPHHRDPFRSVARRAGPAGGLGARDRGHDPPGL